MADEPSLTDSELREVTAQFCYSVYASKKVADGGLSLPQWEGLHDAEREAWRAVAEQVTAKKLPAFVRTRAARKATTGE